MRRSVTRQLTKLCRPIGRWLGVLISVALLVWVLCSFDLSEVMTALRLVNYLYLIPVFILITLNFALRAWRWSALFGDMCTPTWGGLFCSMMIGYLGNNVLPARAGELVRAYVLGQREGIAKSTVLATIVVERVVDLVVTLFLLAALLLFFPLPAWLGRAGTVVGVIGLAALVFLIGLAVWGVRLVSWITHWLRFLPAGLVSKIEAMGDGFVLGVSELRNGRRMVLFSFYTAAIWFLESLFVWLTAHVFALPISIGGSLFTMLAVAVGTMIPSSPGYVGTYEFFATNALAALGISDGRALGFALVMHAVTFLGTSLLGMACLTPYWYAKVLRFHSTTQASCHRPTDE